MAACDLRGEKGQREHEEEGEEAARIVAVPALARKHEE